MKGEAEESGGAGDEHLACRLKRGPRADVVLQIEDGVLRRAGCSKQKRALNISSYRVTQGREARAWRRVGLTTFIETLSYLTERRKEFVKNFKSVDNDVKLEHRLRLDFMVYGRDIKPAACNQTRPNQQAKHDQGLQWLWALGA